MKGLVKIPNVDFKKLGDAILELEESDESLIVLEEFKLLHEAFLDMANACENNINCLMDDAKTLTE